MRTLNLPTWWRRWRRDLAIVLLAVAAGLIVRAPLMLLPMRFDEAFSFLTYATKGIHYLTTVYDFPNNQVLNTLLMHVSWRAFGNHLWVIRLPAFLAGAAIPAAAYAAARALYGSKAALWAAGLTATYAPLVDFSVNGRGYTIGILLILVMIALGARLLERPSPWGWRAFVACGVLSIYAIPTMAYGVAGVGLWMLFARFPRRGRIELRATAALAGATLAVAGLSLLLYWPVVDQGGWRAVQPLPRSAHAIWALAEAVWANWNRAAPHPVDWLLTIGFVTAVVVHRRVARQAVPLAAAMLLVVIGVLGVGRIPPFARSWLYLSPVYLITAGAGMSYLVERAAARFEGGRRFGQPAVVLAVSLALGLNVTLTGQRGSEAPPQSDNHIVRFLRGYLRPGQSVVIDRHYTRPAVEYYMARYGFWRSVNALTREQRASGHAVVVEAGSSPKVAVQTVREAGGRVGPEPPRLVRNFRYISVYDVRLRRTARRG